MLRRTAFSTLASCLILGSSVAWAEGAIVETICLSGEPAPGTTPGVVFKQFSFHSGSPLPEIGAPPPLVVETGFITFGAQVGGPGIGNSEGIWRVRPNGELVLVARAGGPTPGLPDGVQFTDLGSPLLNDVGQVAFAARVGLSSPYATYISEPNGDLRLEFQSGDPAPEPPGAVFARLTPIGFTNQGGLGFLGELAVGPGGVTAGRSHGAWSPDGEGGLVEVTRQLSPAPDLPEGTLFGRAVPSVPAMNARGEVAFRQSLERGTGDVDYSNDSAIFGPAPQGEDTVLLARRGSPAPGGPPGSVFLAFHDLAPALDEQGRVAFRAATTDGPEGIWGPDEDGDITLLALRGTQAPGAPAGATYGQLWLTPAIGGGRVAFSSQLFLEGQLSSEDGVFGPSPEGVPVLRFITGETLPGAIRGPIDRLFGQPIINALGQVAAPATLGFGQLNAVLYVNPDGEKGIVVQADQQLEVRPGDVRIVKGVSLAPRLTKAGELLFRASFTDGSNGLFRATLPPFRVDVEIDIRPRSPRNLVLPSSRGSIPVAVLGSPRFDVLEIDPGSLAFGAGMAAPVRFRTARLLDVNRDGLLDLVSYFRVRDTGIELGDEEACISGVTSDGVPIEGCDFVDTVTARQLWRWFLQMVFAWRHT
jgi:hypothetical protein